MANSKKQHRNKNGLENTQTQMQHSEIHRKTRNNSFRHQQKHKNLPGAARPAAGPKKTRMTNRLKKQHRNKHGLKKYKNTNATIKNPEQNSKQLIATSKQHEHPEGRAFVDGATKNRNDKQTHKATQRNTQTQMQQSKI